jgi:antitoxin CptB|tara:strand:- start:47 stop:292 length:246 start_codon:yes stop_codon:yes gene_type:complete
MNSNKQNLINKIIYRSQYRGTKEMDIFVSSFVKSIIDSLPIDDLKDLDLLVNMNDEDIYKISKKEINFKNSKILKLLIDFR